MWGGKEGRNVGGGGAVRWGGEEKGGGRGGGEWGRRWGGREGAAWLCGQCWITSLVASLQTTASSRLPHSWGGTL